MIFDGCIVKCRRFVVPGYEDFIVEVSPDPFDFKFLDFYLCNKNYGNKMLMFSFTPHFDYLDDLDDVELRSYIFNDGLIDYIEFYLEENADDFMVYLKEDPE